MSKILVVVESGGKVKKIEDILNSLDDGNTYKVFACVGHIMDLPKKELGIDVNNKFSLTFEVLEDKRNVIKNLKQNYELCDKIYLASDPDREGEKISESIASILKLKNPNRVTFNPITHDEVEKSIKSPRKIDYDLVHAQEARRCLDRLVGYPVSNILMKSLGIRNLSAGRVQSVVQRLIVEKEAEIENCLKDDINSFFEINGSFHYEKSILDAHLKKCSGEEPDKIETKDVALSILEKCSKSTFKINDITNKESKRNPNPPFSTSTLQQEASRRLGFTIKRTMDAAQKLYEKGHITYMRTDSCSLSNESIKQMINYIEKVYGKEYCRETHYKSKSANTQEAHEAIRPTDAFKVNIKENEDEMKLYNLIWRRAVASQMSPAIINVMKITIDISKIKTYCFVSIINTIKFAGFMKILKDEEIEGIIINDTSSKKVQPEKIIAIQKYKNPPVRYNEASLLEILKPENLNIGRPSTYGTIIEKIIERGYVEKKNIDGIEKDIEIFEWDGVKIKNRVEQILYGKETNKITPTSLGKIVNTYLCENFKEIMEYEFTAKMEKMLDDIAEGNTTYIKVIESFYEMFGKLLDNAKKENVGKLLGSHPDGDKIYMKFARFGPVVEKINKKTKKATYAPIREPLTMENITIENAIEIFEYPKILGQYGGKDVILNKGKYGLFLKYDKDNYKIPEIEELTFENAVKLIDGIKKNILWEKYDGKNRYCVLNGKYGTYVSIKNLQTLKIVNVKLPKNIKLDDLTIEKIKELKSSSIQKKRFFKKKFPSK